MQKILLAVVGLSMILSSCKTSEKNKKSNEKDAKIYQVPKYKGAYTRYVDLVHTKLFLTPVWKKQELIGRAEIILHQHFFATDSIVLDARAMEIKKVSLRTNEIENDLIYEYNNDLLKIKLPRKYLSSEMIDLNIDYISKPLNAGSGGSNAIKSDQGLFFINADGSDQSAPTELWSQGETESNSVWFPTIESPEQKTTTEIYLTVDSSLTTLSNGLLVNTTFNNDHTKTDHWIQDLPAAPYLAMIAVGNFSIVKDSWRNKEVSYYVDPPYEKYARLAFGKTPEMIEFFSTLTGIVYPWQKYSQIVVHNYISGAMENVTAVVHGTNMQQDPGANLDENYEDYISHELFHHWFGDLVTCRSWANISLNESFANYGEYLWREYKYGKANAQEHLMEDLHKYLNSSLKSDPPLFRVSYNNAEDVYDRISYEKGGCTLNMLRNYLGDTAFFSGLNLYLTQYKFSSTEIDQLRQCFEKISGEDLNWFFNQWFRRGGHPELIVNYDWNEQNKTEQIKIEQVQSLDKNPLYRLPLDIDFYFNDSTVRKKIICDRSSQTFSFPFSIKPIIAVVDGERTLAGTIKDNKSTDELIYLYDHSKNIFDKFQALTSLGFISDTSSIGSKLQVRALGDESARVREVALNYTMIICQNAPNLIKDKIIEIALHDSSTKNRSIALERLRYYYPAEVSLPILRASLKDQSHRVVAEAFTQLSVKEPAEGRMAAHELENDSSDLVLIALTDYYSENDYDDAINVFTNAMNKVDRWGKFTVSENLEGYLTICKNISVIKRGVSLLSTHATHSPINYYRTKCYQNLLKVQEYVEKGYTSANKNLSDWVKINKFANAEEAKNKLKDLDLFIIDQLSEIKISK